MKLHPITCGPKCLKCIAMIGATETAIVSRNNWEAITAKKAKGRTLHLVMCGVYDTPKKTCNCGKINVQTA